MAERERAGRPRWVWAATAELYPELLRAGADKIAINTAAVQNPDLIAACADAFGSQAVVVAVDAHRPGDVVTLELIRNGSSTTVQATLDQA